MRFPAEWHKSCIPLWLMGIAYFFDLFCNALNFGSLLAMAQNRLLQKLQKEKRMSAYDELHAIREQAHGIMTLRGFTGRQCYAFSRILGAREEISLCQWRNFVSGPKRLALLKAPTVIMVLKEMNKLYNQIGELEWRRYCAENLKG